MHRSPEGEILQSCALRTAFEVSTELFYAYLCDFHREFQWFRESPAPKHAGRVLLKP